MAEDLVDDEAGGACVLDLVFWSSVLQRTVCALGCGFGHGVRARRLLIWLMYRLFHTARASSMSTTYCDRDSSDRGAHMIDALSRSA